MLPFLCAVATTDAFVPRITAVFVDAARCGTMMTAEPPPKRKIRQQLPLDINVSPASPARTTFASGTGIKAILSGQPVRTVRRVSLIVRLKRVLQGVLYTLQRSVGFVLQLFGLFLAMLDGVRQRLLVMIGDDDEVDDNDAADNSDRRASINVDEDVNNRVSTPDEDSRRASKALPQGTQGAVKAITVDGIKISAKSVADTVPPTDTLAPVPAANTVKPEIATLVKLVDSAEERKRRAGLENAQQQVLQRLQEIEDMEKGSAASKEARVTLWRAQQSYAERKLEEIEQLERSAKSSPGLSFASPSTAARPPTADLLRHASIGGAASASASILDKMSELFKQVSSGAAATSPTKSAPTAAVPSPPSPPAPPAPPALPAAEAAEAAEVAADAAFAAEVRSFGAKLLPPMSTQRLLGYAREIDLQPGTVVRAGEAARVSADGGDGAGAGGTGVGPA